MDIIEIIVLIVVGMAFVGGGILLGELRGGVGGLVLYVVILYQLGFIPIWVLIIVFVLIIVAFGLFLYLAFCSFDGCSEVDAIKQVKRFLGFQFKDDYTIMKFYQETIPDFILDITISLPDDSFQEITAFWDSLKLETEKNEDKAAEYKYGWEKIEKTDRYAAFGQDVEEDTNIFKKSYFEYRKNGSGIDSYTSLTVDCDNKTLTYIAGTT